MDKELFTIKGQKKIVYEISNKFKDTNKIYDVKIYPVTVSQYLLDCVTRKNFSFYHKSIKSAVEYATRSRGFFPDDGSKVVVFVEGKKIIKPQLKSIIDYDENIDVDIYYESDKIVGFINFVDTIYHELSHVLQKKMNNPYFNFIKDIEKVIKLSDYNHYNKYHDKYFSEIDADIRAINYTNEYIKGYEDIFKYSSNYIEEQRKSREKRFMEYDFNMFFNKFYLFIQSSNKSNILIKKWLSEKKWFNVFFTSDGSFKNLDYILSYLRFNSEFDNNIAYDILSSTVFISQIDYSCVSDDSIVMMKKIVCSKISDLKRKYELNKSFRIMNEIDILETHKQKIDSLLEVKVR